MQIQKKDCPFYKIRHNKSVRRIKRMFARHLEVNEFLDIMMVTPKKIWKQVICLDNGIAGIVYGFLDQGTFYYLDRFYPSKQKEEEIQNMDFYELHKELYTKLNLKVHLVAQQFNLN